MSFFDEPSRNRETWWSKGRIIGPITAEFQIPFWLGWFTCYLTDKL